MLQKCYLRNAVVYIPTVGRRGGAYTIMEPVSVVPLADTEGVRRALLGVIKKGNVAVPLLKGKQPPPLLLKYVGVKSWSAFVQSSLTWDVKEIDGAYQIVGDKLHPEGYWVEDPNQKIEFPPGTAVEVVVGRLIGILQDAAAKP
jgi:hypothetical protein